jgi:hypothetical protein
MFGIGGTLIKLEADFCLGIGTNRRIALTDRMPVIFAGRLEFAPNVTASYKHTQADSG